MFEIYMFPLETMYFTGTHTGEETDYQVILVVRTDMIKLIFDAQERGQLFNLVDDPVELNNLFDHPDHADVQSTLLGWTLRVQDPLPHPRRRYRFKSDKRNYWSPHSDKIG